MAELLLCAHLYLVHGRVVALCSTLVHGRVVALCSTLVHGRVVALCSTLVHGRVVALLNFSPWQSCCFAHL